MFKILPMKNYTWRHVEQKLGVQSLPNLHILSDGTCDVGIIQKPKDTKGCKNLWSCGVGCGYSARFIGHRATLGQARAYVLRCVSGVPTEVRS